MPHEANKYAPAPLARADVPPYAARQWVVVGCASSPFFALALWAVSSYQHQLMLISLMMAFMIVAASAVLYIIEQRIKKMQSEIRDHLRSPD
jgi:hypothetical protein